MTRPSPAAALNGSRTGHICDRCNRGIRTGDKALAYATWYESEGWAVRRVWCGRDQCGSSNIGLETDGADEVVVSAVYWSGQLVCVKTVDRSCP